MREASRRLRGFAPSTILALGASLLLAAGPAHAGVKYFGDGAVQNARGGWDLPKQGSCPADLTATSRPECIARRYAAASSSACTALGAAGQYSWSTGVCNDLVNTTEAACKKAVDRYWNAGAGVCAIVMEDDDRNQINCYRHGGTWVTSGTCIANWVMPSRTDPAYGGLIANDNSTGSAGTGDQCLRCHNTVTQYNGPRVRDTEFTLMQGHKNMARPVSKTFLPWGGPDFSCTGKATATNQHDCVAAGGTWDPTIYPADDSGNTIDFTKNKITVGGTAYDLKWVYGDWLSPLPRAIYTGASLNNMSYSCGRCHTTGWTSDPGTTPNANKHPELDFPGITWKGATDATTGKVKLGGGVAGDPNVMSSWDQWGITCGRCHSSAVDDTTAAPSFAAPPGMSMHHSSMTSPNINNGFCTDTRWTSAPSGSTLEAACVSTGGTFVTACSVNPTAAVCTMAANTKDKCTAVSGTWVAAKAGWCSNAFYADSASCTANKYTWQDGWCKTSDAQSACTGGSGDAAKTWRANGTQASCQVAGAAWSFASCTVEGYCSVGSCTNSKYTNEMDCTAAGATWWAIRSKSACDSVGGSFAYATDIVTCGDAGGRWIGNNTARGPAITRLCMDCHRQEASGLPYTNGSCSDGKSTTQGACVAAGATWTDTGNGLPVVVGVYHNTVTFPSHPAGNQFLNSPHAKFTGKWADIATGRYTGTSSGKYLSSFMNFGEAYNTGNGCTGCHEIHTSIVAGEKPFREECNVCHHVKNLEHVLHPKGAGTPFEKAEEDPMEACVTCHMPEGQHLFRISTDPEYSTFPPAQTLTANTGANTAADGAYTNAVWVDLDAACGQCHGGGNGNVKTTGSIAKGSASLTVASAAGLAVGERINVAGAGAWEAPGKAYELHTYVKSIAGNVVTLSGSATTAVTNAAVEQNPTHHGASYATKADLAFYAKGIHNDTPEARFTAVKGANELTVSVDASGTKCRGNASNCGAFDWNWGDNSDHGSGVKATHTYAAPGNYTITLTVEDEETGEGTGTATFAAKAIPGAPVVTGTCTPDYSKWAVSCAITVPTGGFSSVAVYFGEGYDATTVNSPAAGTLTVNHTYATFGNFTIMAKATNAAGQSTMAPIGYMYRGLFVTDKNK